MAIFAYSPMFPRTADTTEYELISSNHVRLVEMNDETFLRVDPEALTLLAERAFADISHLLRSSHLNQLANILKDSEATKNDRFVALEMLKNAVISAEGLLPMCQDT
ncbi:fumarate hydratase, partial [Candidatus Puniceispirillum sp.]|nr:fumarate hydratase [Candidatus Puniceispirillum sp.]